MMTRILARLALFVAVIPVLLASCGDEDEGCDRVLHPVLTYAIDDVAGCIDSSVAGELVIGCVGEMDIINPLAVCYRNSDSGQMVYSFNIYPSVDPGWAIENCSYSLPSDACP